MKGSYFVHSFSNGNNSGTRLMSSDYFSGFMITAICNYSQGVCLNEELSVKKEKEFISVEI